MQTVALTRESKMNWWQQWLELPHKLRLHNAVFQIHFWIGAIAAMYLAFMSLTGSIIVYRNELSRWTSVDWIVKLHSLLLSSPFASSSSYCGEFLESISRSRIRFYNDWPRLQRDPADPVDAFRAVMRYSDNPASLVGSIPPEDAT